MGLDKFGVDPEYLKHGTFCTKRIFLYYIEYWEWPLLEKKCTVKDNFLEKYKGMVCNDIDNKGTKYKISGKYMDFATVQRGVWVVLSGPL